MDESNNGMVWYGVGMISKGLLCYGMVWWAKYGMVIPYYDGMVEQVHCA